VALELSDVDRRAAETPSGVQRSRRRVAGTYRLTMLNPVTRTDDPAYRFR
jgi:hypothetical protein